MQLFPYNRTLIIKTLFIVLVFSALLFIDRVGAQEEQNQIINFEIEKSKLPSDSPFLDETPRIDEQAAETVKESKGEENYQALLAQNGKCQTLPQNFWVMILSAYIFLIIFNLAYEFGKDDKLRWFWEIFYTVLALLVWYNFDECRKNGWFAQSVIIEGVIIYSFYFYFFNQKIINKKTQNTDPENQGKLFE